MKDPMAVVRPFRAVRPTPENAGRVAAVPYDVVDTDQARALAHGNPLSFLHVSRAEIDLPPGTDPHADQVYGLARDHYRQLKREAPLLEESEPSIYLYRLQADGHVQTGIAACYSLDEYESGSIKKHERTRRDKEDDRTRHMIELNAQTGPVFLIFRPTSALQSLVDKWIGAEPLFAFEAADRVRHTLWRLPSQAASAFVEAFSTIPALYIADGHHRAASAARARATLTSSREASFFLAVAFPADQARIMPYNRVVRDLNGLTTDRLLSELRRSGVRVGSGGPEPRQKGEISMYVDRSWYSLRFDAP